MDRNARKRARRVICGLGEEWLVAALTLWKSHQRVCVVVCAALEARFFIRGRRRGEGGGECVRSVCCVVCARVPAGQSDAERARRVCIFCIGEWRHLTCPREESGSRGNCGSVQRGAGGRGLVGVLWVTGRVDSGGGDGAGGLDGAGIDWSCGVFCQNPQHSAHTALAGSLSRSTFERPEPLTLIPPAHTISHRHVLLSLLSSLPHRSIRIAVNEPLELQ